jgi:hypothetical protein
MGPRAQRGAKNTPRHLRLYHSFLRQQAWKALDAIARAVYIEIAQRYCGTNNGRIPYSVREAVATFKIGQGTACRALQRLQEHGFIVPVTKSAFSLKTRQATEWRLSEHHCDVTNALASRDFERWKPAPAKPPTPKENKSTGGRATALSNGAPARPSLTESNNNQGKPKPPNAVTRAELEASFARQRNPTPLVN